MKLAVRYIGKENPRSWLRARSGARSRSRSWSASWARSRSRSRLWSWSELGSLTHLTDKTVTRTDNRYQVRGDHGFYESLEKVLDLE